MTNEYGMLLHTHYFNFSPQKNTGEALTLHTKFISNGSPDGFYLDQQLELSSYGNAAFFHISDIFTPEILRKLADELEGMIEQVKKL